MGFAIKRILDEDRAKYNFRIASNKWVIDQDNNIILMYTGQLHYGEFRKFKLNIDSDILFILTKVQEQQLPFANDELKYDVTFEVVYIEKTNKYSLKILQNIVRDALMESGKSCSKEFTNKVDVIFNLDDQYIRFKDFK